MTKKSIRFFCAVLTIAMFLSFGVTSAIAELRGSGSTPGVVNGSGTFDVEVRGTTSTSMTLLRVYSTQSDSDNLISIRVFRGSVCVYEGGILRGDSTLDCYLPALSPTGTYTVEYSAASSTYLMAIVNP